MEEEVTESNLMIGLVRQVSKMEGMLTQAISSQADSIAQHGKSIGSINHNMSKIEGTVGQHTTEIINIKQDVSDIQDKQNSSWTRVVALLGLIVAAAGFIWSTLGR